AARGARAYLCVAGGIDVPLVMGSRSTDLQTGLGGFHGRMIRRGDVLAVLPAASARRAVARIAPPAQSGPIRLITGPEFEQFDAGSRAALFESPWRISPHSNRMGFRLEGPRLARTTGGDLKSHAVFPGVIQVPPSGAPIVLMADAHATGGYPRIATVIAADRGRLAQVPPGAAVQFAACTRAAALQAWRQQQAFLQALRSQDHAH
ncbi:MAG: allophanate hydrolase, partial [Proteobacteria bacterium]|nr:allophanate hydrolase [Pseudomonadota bacterium]